MNRAGREPAEDVKRRMMHASEEAGLKVSTGRMYLSKEAGVRVILVCASVPEWPYERPMLNLLTTVGIDGQWSGKVDIRCAAAEDNPIMEFWNTPTLRGRNAVPLNCLVGELRETVEEWQQVVAAKKLGIPGPYPFKNAFWDRPTSITE
jgi:hypothetical protein